MTQTTPHHARIVTTGDGAVTVETAGHEFGTFGIGIQAHIVECLPVSQLPEGVVVATVAPGDEPLSERVTVQHGDIREHVSDYQTTIGSFV